MPWRRQRLAAISAARRAISTTPPDISQGISCDPLGAPAGPHASSVPLWLLRLKTGGATIDLNGRQMDLEDLRLTVRDLERFGPTLVLDQVNDGGDRVLVWSQ